MACSGQHNAPMMFTSHSLKPVNMYVTWQKEIEVEDEREVVSQLGDYPGSLKVEDGRPERWQHNFKDGRMKPQVQECRWPSEAGGVKRTDLHLEPPARSTALMTP